MIFQAYVQPASNRAGNGTSKSGHYSRQERIIALADQDGGNRPTQRKTTIDRQVRKSQDAKRNQNTQSNQSENQTNLQGPPH